MKLLSVASEIFPLIKTGGLADVVGALPGALAREGIAVRSLVPGYPAVMGTIEAGEPACELGTLFGGPARLVAGRAAGLDLIALDAPHLFARAGNPYVDAQGRDWPDNAVRFAALSLAAAAAAAATGAVASFVPDAIHAHDWQAGLVAAYLRLRPEVTPPVLLTIHNLAFQGLFPVHLAGLVRLPPEAITPEG